MVETTSRRDPDPIEVGWVAGILDGEGSCGLYEVRNKGNGTQSLGIKISVTSTEFSLLRRLSEIYSRWGVHYYYTLNRHQGKKGREHWHDSVAITVCRINSVVRLLRIVLPYLTCKKPRAELILEFAEWKQASRFNDRDWERDWHGRRLPHKARTEEEIAKEMSFLERFRQLPAKQPKIALSTTIRRGSQPIRLKAESMK